MKNIISICFLVYVLLTSTIAISVEQADIKSVADNAAKIVAQGNSLKLMEYIHDSGVTTSGDSEISAARVKKLLSDKNSWLYKKLFKSNNSPKNYFNNAKNLKIKIHYYTDKNAHVVYESDNFSKEQWVESCFFRHDGKWYFEQIFSCD